jgi:hypothetical protein
MRHSCRPVMNGLQGKRRGLIMQTNDTVNIATPAGGLIWAEWISYANNDGV